MREGGANLEKVQIFFFIIWKASQTLLAWMSKNLVGLDGGQILPSLSKIQICIKYSTYLYILGNLTISGMQWWHVTCDTWHLTHDMWHMTNFGDRRQVTFLLFFSMVSKTVWPVGHWGGFDYNVITLSHCLALKLSHYHTVTLNLEPIKLVRGSLYVFRKSKQNWSNIIYKQVSHNCILR